MKLTEKQVVDLFRNHYGTLPDEMVALPPSGSSRNYYRMKLGHESVIATFNPDVRENKAFLWMTRHFGRLGLPVPEILAEDNEVQTYLQADLGDVSLFSLLPHCQPGDHFHPNIVGLYRAAISWLVQFQVKAYDGFDFNVCYPRNAFDRYSMMWDLNYFKYYFLKTSGIAFDEQKLEDSFELFITSLMQHPDDFFMYRDFQSRNIMVYEGQPYFIDYQGGRRGPLHYDIASLLFDAKANIPHALRKQLLEDYIAEAVEVAGIDTLQFRKGYYDFVLIRVMQALATYGFRGGVEKKPLFLQSMPFALHNVRWLAENDLLPRRNPYLCHIMEQVAAMAPSSPLGSLAQGLTISIKSFSYRNGIPGDDSGHGGGFVFDCRILPNPGRLQPYKHLTGQDNRVAAFLREHGDFVAFMDSVTAICEQAVENHLRRGFSSLVIGFGCTGGQHRSVFCAETLAAHLQAKFKTQVVLSHLEENNWPARAFTFPKEANHG